MYKFLKKFTILLFIWMVLFSIIDKIKANEITVTTTGDSNTLNILQDGIDNYIDLNTYSFETGDMEIKQNGNYNSVNLDITAGTGTGSSFYIYQNGNSNTYNAELYCGAEWCTMTVNQP